MRLRVPGTVSVVLLSLLLGCPSPESHRDAAGLLATLPEDMDLVAFVDVKAVQEHPLWAKLEDDPFLQAGEETLAQFEEVSGLDPLQDFEMLLFAARGLGKSEMEMAVFARGRIDRDRIEAFLERNGWSSERQGTLGLFALGFDGPEEAGVPELEDTRLAFLDDFTIAVGSSKILGDSAAVREGNAAPLVRSADMGPLIEEGLGSGQFWGVFRSRYLAGKLRDRIEEGIPLVGVLKGFSGVQVVRYSMRFSDSIDLVARARTSTESEAQLLADTLNGFLALAKLAAKDRPAVLRFLEGALVGLDLDSVRLSMNVDGATLDRIRGGLLRDLGVAGGPD